MNNSIYSKLNSNDLPTQVEGFENALAELTQFYDSCISTLGKTTDKLVVAEQIFKIKNALDDKLKHLFESKDTSIENKLYAVSLLYGTSQNTHYEEFLLEIAGKEIWEFANMALLKLRQNASLKSIPIIIKHLEDAEITAIDKVNFLLDCLEQLKAELPEHLKTKFTDMNVPWQIRLRIEGK